jgi:alpha-beta hydrolase superfamily lysophospholipase
MAPTNQQFSVRGANNTDLFSQCWLPAAAPRSVVVLVHGFGEHSDRYTNMVTALTDAGHALYAFDHRGHGRSPGIRGHADRADELIDDTQQVVLRAQHDYPNTPTFVLGHSLGGLIALAFVLKHPEGLAGVIASAPLLAQPAISPLTLTLAKLLSTIAPTFALDTKLDAATISRDPAEVQRYSADPMVHSKTSARAGAEVIKTIHWVQTHAGDLRVPLLLYHGGGDQLVPIEGSRTFFAKATLSDKTFLELPGGYHESHNDVDRDALFRQVVMWIDAHS